MRTLYLDKKIELRELDKPSQSGDMALVRVLRAGICNTDLELVKGYMGFKGVLGHEFVGEVEACSNSQLLDRRVCGEINFGCGSCPMCLKGMGRHCPNRTVLGILNQNGAFADYVLIPNENLHLVPETVSDAQAVFVEPVAAALEILEQVHVAPDSRVAVIGDGKLGLLISQVLRLTGCHLTLFGKHVRKLALAESWGIRGQTVEEVPSGQFDVVVEASGSASGFETAMQLLKPRGTMVLKSTYHSELRLNAAPIVIDEITVVGSRCGPFAPAIRLLQRGLIDVESLIEEEYEIGEYDEAFQHAADSESLKILFSLDD